jgi:hypothetical protein
VEYSLVAPREDFLAQAACLGHSSLPIVSDSPHITLFLPTETGLLSGFRPSSNHQTSELKHYPCNLICLANAIPDSRYLGHNRNRYLCRSLTVYLKTNWSMQ